MPLISVVIAACDRPHTLPYAVGSVLASGGDVEVIVIDDSPTQSARPVIAVMGDQRVQYHANPHPTGGRPAVVRNLGWPLASGVFVHFLDDDDLVAPGYYDRARAAFASHRVGAVFGQVEPFSADDVDLGGERRFFSGARRRALWCARLGPRWGFTAAMLFRPTLLVCGAGMVRREVIPAINGFDETLPILEDVDFHMRAMRQASVAFIDAPALKYRIGPSLMRSPDRQPKIDESYRMIHARYRKEHGMAEYMILKIAAKCF